MTKESELFFHYTTDGRRARKNFEQTMHMIKCAKIEVPTTIKFTSPDIEKLESMVRRAVESWGDYSPTPQSKAGRVLKEMRDYLNEALKKMEGE